MTSTLINDAAITASPPANLSRAPSSSNKDFHRCFCRRRRAGGDPRSARPSPTPIVTSPISPIDGDAFDRAFAPQDVVFLSAKPRLLSGVMNHLSGLIQSISKPRYEEDSVDRLNYKLTTYIAVFGALTIFSKEYWGDPIQCWTKAEFPDPWVQYTRDICFIENTYYVPLDRSVPRMSASAQSKTLIYYQWVPFILIFQALCYNAPHVFWRMLNWTSGFQLRAVITMAHHASAKKSEDAAKDVRTIVNHMHDGFRAKFKFVAHSSLLVLLTRLGINFFCDSYLCVIYIATKVLFILNNALQFVFLAAFVGGGDRWWGWHVTTALLRGETWRETGLFPRVTMCDFKINKDNKTLLPYSVQCVLSANMLNEKLFVFLWWWAAVLEVATISNLFYWIGVIHSYESRKTFIRDLLTSGKPCDDQTNEEYFENQLDGFVKDYVKRDGVLVFRLMVNNAGEMVTSTIVAKLFDEYKEFCLAQRASQLKQNSRILAHMAAPTDSERK